ncbi:MAG: RNA 2',3'-cyclic phosphodiesterase [Bacteriovorax sp.]|jgi:2'-5' RNA ligase
MKLALAINAGHLKLDENKFKKLKVSLSRKTVPYRWIPTDLLHITLLNLGETDHDKIPELDQKIKQIVNAYGVFELKLNGIWAYPNQKEGRLLWIGVQNSITLQALQRELAEELVDEKDFREDKIFRPVLPIVRLKNHINVTDMISPYRGFDFGKIKVEQLVLYDMVSGGAYPLYKLVKTYSIHPGLKNIQPDMSQAE